MCVLSASDGEYSYSLLSHTLAVDAARLGVFDSLLSVHTNAPALVDGLGIALVLAGDAGNFLLLAAVSFDFGSIGDDGSASSSLLASNRASAAAATTRAAGRGGTGSDPVEKLV